MLEKCPIDKRNSASGIKEENKYHFCNYHFSAYNNLRQGYKIWKERIEEELSWEHYLQLLLELKEEQENLVGEWVKGVIEFLLRK